MSGNAQKGMTTTQAERAWYLQAIDALKSEARKHESEARLYLKQIEQAEWELAAEKSRARARRQYDFVGDVHEHAVREAVDDISDWARESSEPITIRLCSPGGSVFDGFMLFDVLRGLSLPVTTIVYGYGASMGSILSQAGSSRLIASNAWFMVHEPSSIALGKAGEVKREAKLLERLHDQACAILAERSKLTKKQVMERSTDKDWWMNAEEALGHGFFDGLAP